MLVNQAIRAVTMLRARLPSFCNAEELSISDSAGAQNQQCVDVLNKAYWSCRIYL